MPDTITFTADDEEHVAVVSDHPYTPNTNSMIRECDGVRYAIFIAMGEIPGYPAVYFIARPVQEAS